MTNTEYLQRYDLLPEGTHVLCALSGGRDSVYLLHRLLEWSGERGLRVSAAHFNHRLRGEESDRDEDFVCTLCRELEVPLYTEGEDVRAYAQSCAMGIEEAARQLRYAFLERIRVQCGADVIATAHHADDLAETMLLNLTRGAGTRGLSGIPPRRDHIVRPMLLVTRREIDAYLSVHGYTYVDDSTNALDDCSRNILRHNVMPVLEQLNPAFVTRAAQAALLLREDDDCLQGQADGFLREHPAEQGIEGSALTALEPAVAARVVRSVWGSGLTAEHVSTIMELCCGTELAFAHVPGTVVRYDQGRLWTDTCGEEPAEVILQGDFGAVQFGEYRISWQTDDYRQEVHNSFNTFVLKYETIEGAVEVTSRRDGDRVRLAGHSHTKRLKQLFQERKLTQPQRAKLPIFRDRLGIVAVHSFGVAQRCVPEIGDKIIIIKCEK